MTHYDIPRYVDPAVLVPGTVVASVLEPETRLVVLRVEPSLICRTLAGDQIAVLAHTVVVEQLPAACDDCGATLVQSPGPGLEHVNVDGSPHDCTAHARTILRIIDRDEQAAIRRRVENGPDQ
jgi:hypothetical protein